MNVLLKVPIIQASEWDPWLTDNLMAAADQAGIECDGGEEEGRFEVFFFADAKPEQVRDLTADVLKKARHPSTVTVTGDEEVTVLLPSSGWLVALGPATEPYDKAMKKLSSKIADDPQFAGWWAGSGHGQLLFHQVHDAEGTKTWNFDDEDTDPPDLFVTAQVDLSILDKDKPPRGAAARVAKANLGLILAKVADQLGLDDPPGL